MSSRRPGRSPSGAYVWWVNRSKATEKRFTGIDARVTEVESKVTAILPTLKNINATCGLKERRIAYLEKESNTISTTIRHMPNHADMSKLSGEIQGLHKSISELNGRFMGLNRVVDLMNQHHINGGDSAEIIKAILNSLSGKGGS